MLNKTELKQIARTRLAEARLLIQRDNHYYEGAVHLCVCAIEIALKKKICDTLDWKGFPETDKEFEDFKSFRTHKQKVLLQLSGQELQLKKDVKVWASWSILQDLDIEIRYVPRGEVNEKKSQRNY